MPIPVIVPPITPRVIARGMPFSVALVASNDPTEWSAAGLPSGLAIDLETGVVSGNPISDGLFTATFTATNEEGPSPPISMVFSVQATPPGGGPWSDIELDWDLIGGGIVIPGIEPVEGEPVLRLKRGDHFPLLFGLTKWGVLQEVDAEAPDVFLQVGIKEFEPERLATISEGLPEKVGETPDQTRYRIWIRLTPAQWSSILDNYEDDQGTEVLALAEAQLVVGRYPELYDESLVEDLTLQGGMGTAGPYGSPALQETFAFEGLGEFFAPIAFRLTVSLVVEGRPSQSMTLVRTFTLIFQSGGWVVASLAGPGSGQGAVEGTRWRVSLIIDVVEGTSGGLDVDLTLTSTDDTTPLHIEAEIPYSTNVNPLPEGDILEYSVESQFELLDSNHQLVGESHWQVPNGIRWSVADLAEAIIETWHEQTGTEDVTGYQILDEGVGASVFTVRFFLAPHSPVHYFGRFPSSVYAHPIASYGRGGGTSAGESAAATLTARLEQLEPATQLPLSRTSRTFRIGVARDMLPDR